jgi:hypothetical protein
VVGVAALIITALLLVCALFFLGPILTRLTRPDQATGFVVYGIHPWPLLAGALVVFAAAFYWTLRKNKTAGHY